mmetsp:Transcript_40301/g.115434  ORF Transcript_40301/g.115434 Transcript_40301/m.115434 type:complete len:455 (-) Transcript_40301:573-1937(-)
MHSSGHCQHLNQVDRCLISKTFGFGGTAPARQSDQLVVQQLQPDLLLRHRLELLGQEDGPATVEAFRERSDLRSHNAGVCKREGLRVLLHVIEGPLVCPGEREDHAIDLHGGTGEEVPWLEPRAGRRVLHPGPCAELAVVEPGVAPADFVNGHGLVSDEKDDSEPPALVLRDLGHHLRLEAELQVALQHELVDVLLRRARHQRLAAGQRVLLRAEPGVRGDLRLGPRFLRDRDVVLALLYAVLFGVEVPCELVAIVNEQLPPVYHYGGAHLQLLGLVGDLLRRDHAWRRVHVRVLVQATALEEHWPRAPPAVLLKHLVDLYGLVREVVVHREKVPHAERRRVVPNAVEAKHLAVVLEVLLETPILLASAEKALVVLLDVEVLLLARLVHGLWAPRGLHGEQVVRERLRRRLRPSGLLVVLARELVAVVDAVRVRVNLDRGATGQVLLGVEAASF